MNAQQLFEHSIEDNFNFQKSIKNGNEIQMISLKIVFKLLDISKYESFIVDYISNFVKNMEIAPV